MRKLNYSIKTKLFILFVSVIIVSVSAIGWIGFDSAKKAYIQSAVISSNAQVKALANRIKGLLGTIPEDVVYNEGFYALEKLLIWEDLKEDYKIKEWKSTYISALTDYLKNKKLYYQVRILDTNGFEKILLKYDESTGRVRTTPVDQLQDKSKREYFKRAIKLKDGEFYISVMNLNVEHGVVEKPFIPVVRYSTPLIDKNGETKGVLVLNFSANKILNMIKDAQIADKENKYNFYMLNEHGDYLYNKNEEKRWGFQLGRYFKFQDDFSGDIFKQFDEQEETTIQTDDKIIAMKKIYPNKAGNPNRYWYLVASIEKTKAFASLEQFIQMFVIVLLIVIIIGTLMINRFITGITTPLIKITSILSALSKGEIKKDDIIYNSNDEIGQIVQSTSIVIEAIQTTINQANLVANGDFTKEIELLSNNDQLGLAIKEMTRRLKDITSVAQKLSIGNYDVKVIPKSSDDQIGIAMLSTLKYYEEIASLAESIAVGNIDLEYKLKSDDDRIGRAILEMVEYLKNILKQANAITNENYDTSIEVKSKNDELGLALITMTDILRENAIKSKEEIWFSEGLGNFSDKLTGIDDTVTLAKEAITMSSRYVNGSSGVLYTFDKNEECLNLIASFAFTSRDNLSNKFKLGEGVIGQVALEREPILLKNIKDEEFEIQSGIVVAKPKEVFTFPLIYEGELFGVAEVMSFEGFTKLHKSYLLKAASIFATALHSTTQNVQIKTLLSESQKAYEELQAKSEEMQAQSEELRASNEQMEQQQQQLQIQSANLEIKNVELNRAKEEIDKKAADLEASNKYKSEFLANMSHELRTPLNSVILLSSLLAKNNKNNLNEADIQKAKVINQSGNELLRLINDILDLSKIESGKMELIVDEINSKELANHYEEVFSHTAKDKGITFKVIDELNGIFYNDQDRLGQVIRNLISNALKFTKDGGVTLKISKTDDEKLPIKISVSDTGVGIPKDKQELIFQAFTQADGSTSRQFGGTGLGLSISKELAHLMQGEIKLESIEGKGSTFTILLPSLEDLYSGKKSTLSVESKKKEIKSSDTIINKKENVTKVQEQFLVVEDDIEFANILKETIEEHGAKVFVAHTGKDGLELAHRHNVNGAIIDLGLPDMNGIDLIKQLKDEPLTSHINIQVISGRDKDSFDFSSVKIDGYLQKPVSSEQINHVLENLEESKNKSLQSILIVEDDELHLKAIKDYIAEENKFDIQTATTVQKAKELIDSKYFDIAIVDLGLSDGSGSDVCRYITNTKKDISVLIYTGRDLTQEEADYLNEISDEIIIKNPNSHERLKDEIERFLTAPTTVNERFANELDEVEKIDYAKGDTDDLQGKSVLIVDDDIKNIFVLTSALQEHDMHINHAKNGQEALDFLNEHPDTNIVLMDIMMPIMDGYEAIKAIRKDEKLKHLPVIAVTAKAMQQDRDEAIKAGADDYLTKPIDLEKLSSMMAVWINKK